MKKLFAVTKKNFLIITYSHLSILLLILGPILLMGIIGLGLSNSGLTNIPTTVYYETESPFTQSFIDSLGKSSFKVSTTQNLQDCIDDVKSKGKNLCIELQKEDFEVPENVGISKEEIESAGGGYKVHLHADFSQPRTVWSIIAKVNSIVEGYSNGIRDSSAKRLENEFSKISSSVELQTKSLHKIINTLEIIESNIEDLQDLIPSSSEVDSLDNKIKEIDLQMSLATEIIPEEYQELILQIKTGFDSLKYLWDTGGYKSLSSSHLIIQGIQNDVKFSIRTLESSREKLSSIKVESDNLQKLSWDYVLHPIPLSYSPIESDFLSSDISEDVQLEGSNASLEFLDYLFPSLIGFFILLISIFLSTNLAIREKISPAKIRNVLSKASPLTFLFGNFITIFVVVFIQVLAILFIASPFLNFPIFYNLPLLILAVGISLPPFILIGILLGNIFNSQETAIMGSISIALLLIIFSSIITPLETLPNFLKVIISFSPLVIVEEIFRKLFIFGATMNQSIFSIISLGILTIFLFFTTLIFVRLSKEKVNLH